MTAVIAIVAFVLWALALLSPISFGTEIHLLLVVAVIATIMRIMSPARSKPYKRSHVYQRRP